MTPAISSATISSACSNWLADTYAAIQIAGCAGIVVGTQQMVWMKNVRRKVCGRLRWLTSS
jgi:hypothetical protein